MPDSVAAGGSLQTATSHQRRQTVLTKRLLEESQCVSERPSIPLYHVCSLLKIREDTESPYLTPLSGKSKPNKLEISRKA